MNEPGKASLKSKPLGGLQFLYEEGRELLMQMNLGIQLQLTEGYAAPEAERTYALLETMGVLEGELAAEKPDPPAKP